MGKKSARLLVAKGPGGRLATSYFRTSFRRTIIGAAAFHFRVRNGNGWGHCAVITRRPLEETRSGERGTRNGRVCRSRSSVPSGARGPAGFLVTNYRCCSLGKNRWRGLGSGSHRPYRTHGTYLRREREFGGGTQRTCARFIPRSAFRAPRWPFGPVL